MSIKSDKWIRKMSQPEGRKRTAVLHEGKFAFWLDSPQGDRWKGSRLRENDNGWDTKEYEYGPMIYPFLEEQLRFDVDGNKVISSGVSSYGYDVRCGNIFKVFTNINSTVVDPKNFDEKNFVEMDTDDTDGYCIIPPNSFALANTMEHFVIPRNVLTICLGKSTYARCFTGDTRVALVDGRSLSLKAMAKRAKKGERFFGYTIMADGSVGVAELLKPRRTARDQAIVRVTLDNGEHIRCTPDHKFMLRDGSYVEAQDLKTNTSLMPLMRYDARGYEMVYCPKGGYLGATHRLADAWNLRNGVYAAKKKQHRHHDDHNRRNNDPRNIVRMSASKHIKMHNAEKFSDPAYMEFHSNQITKGLRKWIDKNTEIFVAHQTSKAKAFWHEPQYADARAEMLAKRNKTLGSGEFRADASERLKERFATGWKPKRRKGKDRHNHRADLTEKTVRKAFDKSGTVVAAAEHLGVSKQTLYRRFSEVITEAQQDGILSTNHRVVSVKSLKKLRDVYCLTVPETSNFALETGVFVHNCGIIVNVTPLEPEFEGAVTLEFSNTTTLPAKIYAGEGVAQMLFFESDEECAVSYKDRGGKYMGQPALPISPRM